MQPLQKKICQNLSQSRIASTCGAASDRYFRFPLKQSVLNASEFIYVVKAKAMYR